MYDSLHNYDLRLPTTVDPLISETFLVQISEKFRYVKLKLYNDVSLVHSMAMATEKVLVLSLIHI